MFSICVEPSKYINTECSVCIKILDCLKLHSEEVSRVDPYEDIELGTVHEIIHSTTCEHHLALMSPINGLLLCSSKIWFSDRLCIQCDDLSELNGRI
ncbi:hypothetical protein OCU04_003524 [Sclerotinia nivalis]|uniref:Uncharacterized protein n=1 Tax=Sclerotinia nivalis TaxID=352851 RepID=A0A9X0AS33_9HELO|nr:hypothetical protein OCU04_003524 [Sclerotinia nivalis]